MASDEMAAEFLLPGDVVLIDGANWRVHRVAVTAGQDVSIDADPVGSGAARTIRLEIGQIVWIRGKATS